MKLTETMKFLSPAIEKTNKILPVLEHVRITQGFAIASNGELSIACPCPIPLECTPNGTLLEQAVKRFGDGFTAVQKPNGDLYFEGNKFKVTIPCTSDFYPMPDFSGTPVMSGKGFVAKIKKLLPFVNEWDEDKPWQNGILLRDGQAFATCGNVLAFCQIDIANGVDVTIPKILAEAMTEVLEEPEFICKSSDKTIVVYSENRFMSAPTIQTGWPSTVKKGNSPGNCGIPEGFFEAVKSIEPFGIGGEKYKFYIRDGYVASSIDSTGAKAEVVGVTGNWFWNYNAVKLIEKHCKNLQLGREFVSWSGDEIEGRSRLGKVPE